MAMDQIFNSSPPVLNGHHFADDVIRCISMSEMLCIFIRISLKFIPEGLINKNPALF